MKIKKIDFRKLNIEIVIFALIMAALYGIMMFTNGPWYDELYTYYSFISRGPVYAAIHWPVPNNHVGYSVLSAFLDLFGNSYIGLRGVSFVAAIANIILIYNFTLRLLNKTRKDKINRACAFMAALLYASANIVHNLSVQGRGYTLAITCLLVAIISLYRICVEGCRTSDYVKFGISLILGLYILPSSMYWVIPVCLIGGFYLLSKKQTKVMWKLILTALIAAVAVVMLYTIIWLAIGANLLCKNPESPLYGLHQVKVILKAPIQSAKTGIEYMLATPYIQSIDRKTATLGMPGYFRDFFEQCYSGLGILMVIVMIAIIILSIMLAIKNYKNNNQFFQWLLVGGSMLLAILMLLIQSVHPYKRVCSFIMVPMSIGITLIISMVISRISSEKVRAIASIAIVAILGVISVIRFTSYDYNRPLADRENHIRDALVAMEKAGESVSNMDKIYLTDDYQKYVLKFYYDVEPEAVSLEEANYVMISPEMTDEDYESNEWPMLVTYDESVIDYIDKNFSKRFRGSEGDLAYIICVR